MNRKNYVEAVNEIKASKELKNKTLQNITKRKKFRKIYAFASLLVMMGISISIFVPMQNKMEEQKKDPVQIVESNNGLPTVGSFSNLYEIINKKNEKEVYLNLTNGEINKEDIKDELANEEVEEIEKQKEYSETNVQVNGVDEADIVKTDGEYIYYVGNKKINIIDSRNPKKIKKIAEIDYQNDESEEFIPKEVYINENKLIVLGYNHQIKENLEELTEGFTSSEIYSVAKVYDVENKKKVTLIRTIEIEGEYLSSRMIGENIYLLTNKYLNTYLFVNKTIEELNEEEFKTQYLDTAVSTEMQKIDFDSICYLPESNDGTYLNIIGFNINNTEKANIESYLGAGSQIYTSKNNLYVAMVKYEYKDAKSHGFYNNIDINTYIYKFELSEGKTNYKNLGSVPGKILNQFSMDENNEYFRIATTNSENWNDEKTTNNMYVLDTELNIIGRLENLAEGEKIYAVRFIGDRAYMVTFVQTDPLFVIDLSEPKNPNVLGELKIPGYSKYLHPYDETHLIGFGEDTKVVNYGYGDVVTTDGMKMALFDVTDPNNPIEQYVVKIGDQGTYSEILNNHKALLFSKEKSIIAFPISITEENYKVTFQGAIVYDVNLETGFNLKGQIAHLDINKEIYDYNKSVERIIYIQDTLITLSKELVKATDMNTMKQQSELEL